MTSPAVKAVILFRGAAGGDAVPPEYSAGEIGDVGVTIIEITFNEQVQSADFALGVTIKINAVAQTINSAVLQAGNKIVHYTIAAAADINDAITWEYDDDFGDIRDLAGNDLADILAQTCVNYIGSQLFFNTEESSAHLVSI